MTRLRNHPFPHGFKIRGVETTEIAPQGDKSIKGTEKDVSRAPLKGKILEHTCPPAGSALAPPASASLCTAGQPQSEGSTQED